MTQPGYKIERDDRGFTEIERQVMHSIVDGKSLSETARKLGVSRQRVFQVVKALEGKGVQVDALRKK